MSDDQDTTAPRATIKHDKTNAIREWLSMAGYLKGALAWSEWLALRLDEKEAVRTHCRELGWDQERPNLF